MILRANARCQASHSGKVAIKFAVESSFGNAPVADALTVAAWLHPDELLCCELPRKR
ncbi:MAG: hypothetical protein K2X57_09810 [Xanthobacteraceae bacterium]|nr:hypothetical protein [Xanthobacteraceae bacterium]